MIEYIIGTLVSLILGWVTLWFFDIPVDNDPNKILWDYNFSNMSEWHWERKRFPVWVWLIVTIICFIPLSIIVLPLIILALVIVTCIMSLCSEGWMYRLYKIGGGTVNRKIYNFIRKKI